MARCTNQTFLMRKASDGDSFSKVVDITEYPDLGGDKEKLDSTTLSDTQKKSINGLQDVADLAFKAWYDKDDYAALLAIEEADTLDTYQLWFGEDGEDGIFQWEGKMHVYPSGGAVNAVAEMSFSTTNEGDDGITFVAA